MLAQASAQALGFEVHGVGWGYRVLGSRVRVWALQFRAWVGVGSVLPGLVLASAWLPRREGRDPAMVRVSRFAFRISGFGFRFGVSD